MIAGGDMRLGVIRGKTHRLDHRAMAFFCDDPLCVIDLRHDQMRAKASVTAPAFPMDERETILVSPLTSRDVAVGLHRDYNADMTTADVGLRELKQNPSDVITRAEAGTEFRVLRNGRPTNVVIHLDTVAKKRWVSASALATAFAEIQPDATGWLDELEQSRENDELRDPWETA
jgi:antitoxin (DNA-binding transcriptional repressor) of toxin-antitoxin stability system